MSDRKCIAIYPRGKDYPDYWNLDLVELRSEQVATITQLAVVSSKGPPVVKIKTDVRGGPPIEPPTVRAALEDVLADFATYEELRNGADMRSWMSDQLHENVRYLLELLGHPPQ